MRRGLVVAGVVLFVAVAVSARSDEAGARRSDSWTASIAVRWVGGPPETLTGHPADPVAYYRAVLSWSVSCEQDPNDLDATPTGGAWRWTLARNPVVSTDLAYVRVPPRPVQGGNFGSTGDHSEEILYAEAGQIVVGHLHFECDFSNGDKLQDDVVSPIDVVPPYLAPPQLWTQGKGRALAERAGGLVAVDPNRLPVNHRIFVNLRIGQKLGSGGFFVVRLNGAGVNLQRKIEPSQLGNKIDLSFTPRRRGSIQLSATTQVVVVGAYHETVPAAHLRSNVVRLLVR